MTNVVNVDFVHVKNIFSDYFSHTFPYYHIIFSYCETKYKLYFLKCIKFLPTHYKHHEQFMANGIKLKN